MLDETNLFRWSIMIPTYNCANYLKDTLESVLKQDLGAERMQIEVIDDCSIKDDPEEVVRLYGKGRVKFYKQPQNVGATSNFNTCVKRSNGNLIHILHGDDTVNEGFYTSIEQVFKDNPDVGICFTRSNIIDENGNLETISPRIIKLETGSNNIDDLIGDSKIGNLAKEISESINLDDLNIENPNDLLNNYFQ